MYSKKTLAIAFMAIGLAAFVGCKKDEIPDDGTNPPSSSMVDKTFTASLDGIAISGESLAAESLIGVYDGYGKSTFSVSTVSEDGVATIEGQVDSRAGEFHAVYPNYAANTPGAQGQISVYLNDKQSVPAGASTATNAIVCIAKEADGHFALKSAVAYLKLDLAGGETSVTVRGNASGPISGDVYIADDGTVTSTDASTVWAETEQSITLSPEGETFAAGTYYICLYPAEFAGGLTISWTTATSTQAKTTTDNVGFTANGIVDAADLTMTDTETGTESNPYTVSTADELAALGTKDYGADVYVRLVADIDMTGKAWTAYPIAFNLDGDGHRIYNIQVTGTGSGSVFNIQSGGSLKNVVFGSEDGTTYDGISAITVTDGNGKIGLLGENRGVLENVITFIPVTAELGGSASSEVRIGGLASSNYNNITSCVNYGDISVTGSVTGNNSFVGGITGWASQGECSIKSTDNHGDITIDNSNLCGAGGIVGMLRGENIEDCENTGTLTVLNSLPQESWIGGIVGFTQQQSGSDKKISNCTNSGDFNVTAASVAGVGGIVGCMNYTPEGPNTLTIENCTNEADVAVTTANGWMHLGGILAREAASGSADIQNRITGCTNNGDIILGAPSGAENTGSAYIGGIAGKVEKKPVIENNVNNGAVSGTKLTSCHAGGILGHASCSDLTLTGNGNSGSVTLSPDKSVAVQCYAGGILGTCITTGQASVTGNENKAETVSIVCNSAAASYNPLSYVGGIIGGTDDKALTTSDNINRADVSSDTQNIWVPTGGLVGLIKGSISMTDDANLGDVTLTSTHTTTGDMFVGGVFGITWMGDDATKTVTLTGVKSYGSFISTGLAGLIGNSAYGNLGKITLKDCLVGGHITKNNNTQTKDFISEPAAKWWLFGYINDATPYEANAFNYGVAADFADLQ